MRDAILLPTALDRVSVDELRPRIEHAAPGASVVLDGSYLQRVETPGV